MSEVGTRPRKTFHRLFVACALGSAACTAFTVERAIAAERSEDAFQAARQTVLAGHADEVSAQPFTDAISAGLAQYEERDAGALVLLVPLTAVMWIRRKREAVDRVISQ